jgi:hypothetical protein
MEDPDMSRATWFSPTRRLIFAALLVPVFLTGCIFSPDEKVIVVEEKIDVAQEPADLIQQLAEAYRSRNIDQFTSILAHDIVANENGDLNDYLFITAPSSGVPDEQWGYTEEVRVHRRMFRPEDTPVGESPVPAELWLTSVTITLTQETAFTERTDLYYDATANPNGLDPELWKAEDAIYGTDVLFDLQGEIDYQVQGQALFVVVTDLTKEIGEDGKFLLLQWNDLAPSKAAADLPS